MVTDIELSYVLGYSIIILVDFNIGFNLMIIIIETYSDTKEKWQKKSAKKRKVTAFSAILSRKAEAEALKRLGRF